VFTARYGLMPYIKQNTFRLLKVKDLRTINEFRDGSRLRF
jgi:hypothetical protein